MSDSSAETNAGTSSCWQQFREVFLIFLRLGLTSFGGPVAHLGYFREEFVERRRWLSDRSYADLVALCQFLPGPASSQVGLGLGMSRAGYAGAAAAWLGFTLPSALVLIALALSITSLGESFPMGALQGLKVVAVAVVAQAVWGMGNSLCVGKLKVSLMALAAAVVLLLPSVLTPVLVIILAGLVGLWKITPDARDPEDFLPIKTSRAHAKRWLIAFFVLLAGLPLLAAVTNNPALNLFDAFYRAGALVFGGGHVVLPLLQSEVVVTGWVENDAFLAGYGAAQAVPGPLFTFAAFLGTAAEGDTVFAGGLLGGLFCLVAIFLPSFLLIAGALPYWEQLRSDVRLQAALAGVNAAVVGILLAALYNPVWTSAVHSAADFVMVLLALIALMVWKLPAWLVVLGSGVIGWIVF
jgi:chromate transporter